MLEKIVRESIRLVPWGLRRSIGRWPLLRAAQRILVRRFAGTSEFLHRIDRGPAAGINFPLVLPADKSIWTGTYEGEFAAQVAAAVKEGMVCYDIGACRGFFGGIMAARGARQTYLFEPLATNADQIRKLLTANPALRLDLLEAAVAGAEGVASFSVMPELSMGKLTASEFQPEAYPSRKVQVPLVTIDRLVSDGRVLPPDLIKIDVEGAEVEVISGGLKTISANKPLIFIEAHSEALLARVEALLTKLGYHLTILSTQHGAGITHVLARPAVL